MTGQDLNVSGILCETVQQIKEEGMKLTIFTKDADAMMWNALFV